MSALEEGTAAPDFTLPTDGGGEFRLADHRGSAVVVYFYPKDDTTGCTREALDFTTLAPSFAAAGAVVVGVSPDSVASHKKFRSKHELGIVLASDETKETLERYGVWAEKSMYGRKYMGVERTTVLVDRAGKVAAIWHKVKVPGHAEAVLDAVKGLAKA
jgi:peroxiredoxin Q/BCP